MHSSASGDVSVTDVADAAVDDHSPGVPCIPWSSVRCGEELGRGGFGVVYRGRWRGSPVAVKCLIAPVARGGSGASGHGGGGDENSVPDEALMLACVVHPNIVQLFGVSRMPRSDGGSGTAAVGYTDTCAALVMELDGESLSRWLQRHRPQRRPRDGGAAIGTAAGSGSDSVAAAGASSVEGSTARPVVVVNRRELQTFWRHVTDILCQVASALAHCHAARPRAIVHCDVKPANVLVQTPGAGGVPRAKLADFGAAVWVAPDASATAHCGSTRTNAVGTARYLSPEQWRGDAVTPQADVYSLGVTAIACFAGKVKWAGQPAKLSDAGVGGRAAGGAAAGAGGADRDDAARASAAWIRAAVLAGRTPIVPQSASACPDAIRALILRCLNMDPRARPTAAEAFVALDELRESLQ
jgi:serine/threonine protein kinase